MRIESPTAPSLSLYHRLGGRTPILIALEHFADRLFADAKLAPLTQGLNRENLRTTLVELALNCLGDSPVAGAKNLSGLTSSVSLTRYQFNRCISHLIVALVWTQVPRRVIEEVLDLVTTLTAPLIHED